MAFRHLVYFPEVNPFTSPYLVRIVSSFHMVVLLVQNFIKVKMYQLQLSSMDRLGGFQNHPKSLKFNQNFTIKNNVYKLGDITSTPPFCNTVHSALSLPRQLLEINLGTFFTNLPLVPKLPPLV